MLNMAVRSMYIAQLGHEAFRQAKRDVGCLGLE